MNYYILFFFQAEDGIRDPLVTGVQTCALPIYALRASLGMTAAYLEPGARREPMYHTPDASRRARGVELWATLKSLGRAGLCELIARTCTHAQRFASGLRNAGFEVFNEEVINQVEGCFVVSAVEC